MRDRNRGASSSLGFTSALQIVFITLKLCKVIDWPWVWVLSPTWVPLGIIIFIFALAYMFDKWSK